MAALDEYRRKRDPAATSEPMPGRRVDPAADEPIAGDSFVIHEHHASALHWDFRLERDGVLVSWAVPKGLPTDPKVNRLAVHVEDHPLEYGRYEGTIGEGQYGAGAVTIWDHGTYRSEKWTEREVKIVLSGQRVQGRFVLFQTGGKNWMMHRMDGPPDPAWQPLPKVIEPMLATPGSLPRGRGWAYEMLWSGVRASARVEGGRLELRAASGVDVTGYFPELRPMAESLGASQLYFDGVLVYFDADGRLAPPVLENRLAATVARARTLARTEPATYLVVDLLHHDGRSLSASPYRTRRELLEALRLDDAAWQVPPVFEGTGTQARRTSREQNLAGVVAKRLSAAYVAGARSEDWIAVTS